MGAILVTADRHVHGSPSQGGACLLGRIAPTVAEAASPEPAETRKKEVSLGNTRLHDEFETDFKGECIEI